MNKPLKIFEPFEKWVLKTLPLAAKEENNRRENILFLFLIATPFFVAWLYDHLLL
tara:strand:+ start:2656 stop:2820 length:165 start_codon:yes stop_codon:yes gene_type:complete